MLHEALSVAVNVPALLFSDYPLRRQHLFLALPEFCPIVFQITSFLILLLVQVLFFAENMCPHVFFLMKFHLAVPIIDTAHVLFS